MNRADLESICSLVDSKTGIVSALIKNVRYNDEPKIFLYVALLSNIYCSGDITDGQDSLTSLGLPGITMTNGASLYEDLAIGKALGEAIERYCCFFYKTEDFLQTSYKDIEDDALDPCKCVSFSRNQLLNENLRDFKFNEKSKFKWVKGFSLNQNRRVYVPAQLVYFPYVFKEEPKIRTTGTNGAAGGKTFATALYHGICECVERDAIVINWLNKLPRERIDIKECESEHIINLLEISRKYKIDLYLYDISTDIPIPTIFAIAVDRSGVGPAVTVGARSNLDYEEAITVSIEEALKRRPMIRMWLNSLEIRRLRDTTDIMRFRESYTRLPSLLNRYLLWSKIEAIPKLDFLLRNGKKKSVTLLKKEKQYFEYDDAKSNIKKILSIFRRKEIEIFYKDATTRDIDELGFKSVRVIIPELQIPYSSEDHKCLGGRRLYEVPRILGYKSKEVKENELNQMPNPF